MNGETYKADRFSFKEITDKASAEHAEHTMVPGSEVYVFYDPEHPARAVLRPGASGTSKRTSGRGVIALVAGLLGVLVYFKSSRNITKSP